MAKKIVITGGGIVSASRAAYISTSKISAEEKTDRRLFNSVESGLTKRKATNYLGGGDAPEEGELREIIFSLNKEDFERFGESIEEQKMVMEEVVREGLGNLWQELGVKDVRYVAGIHLNTNNPHAHIAFMRDAFDIKTGAKRDLPQIPKNWFWRNNGENSKIAQLFENAVAKNSKATPPQHILTEATDKVFLPAREFNDARIEKTLNRLSEINQIAPQHIEQLIENRSLYVSRQGALTFLRRDAEGKTTGYVYEAGYQPLEDKGFFYIGNPNTATRYIIVENPKEALAALELTSHRDLSDVCIVASDKKQSPVAFTNFLRERSSEQAVRVIWALGLDRNEVQETAHYEELQIALTESRSDNAPTLEFFSWTPKPGFGRNWSSQLQFRNIPGELNGIIKKVFVADEKQFDALDETFTAEYQNRIAATFDNVIIENEEEVFIVYQKTSEGKGIEYGRYVSVPPAETDEFATPEFAMVLNDGVRWGAFNDELEVINGIQESYERRIESEFLEAEAQSEVESENLTENSDAAETSETVVESAPTRTLSAVEITDRLKAIPLEDVMPRLGLHLGYDKDRYEYVYSDSGKQFKIKVRGDLFSDRYDDRRGGRNAINLVMHVQGTKFAEARQFLLDNFGTDYLPQETQEKVLVREAAERVKQPFVMPEPNDNKLPAIYRYLTDQRAISEDIVTTMIERGFLFANNLSSPVFVNKDENEMVKGASWRATVGTRRGDYTGSEKVDAWFYLGNPKTASRFIIVESPIEAMSYYDLHRDSVNLQETAIISTATNSVPLSLVKLLERNAGADAELVIAYNNDPRGQDGALFLLEKIGRFAMLKHKAHFENNTIETTDFSGRVVLDVPQTEDWNEDLKAVRDSYRLEADAEHISEEIEAESRPELPAQPADIIGLESLRIVSMEGQINNADGTKRIFPVEFKTITAFNEYLKAHKPNLGSYKTDVILALDNETSIEQTFLLYADTPDTLEGFLKVEINKLERMLNLDAFKDEIERIQDEISIIKYILKTTQQIVIEESKEFARQEYPAVSESEKGNDYYEAELINSVKVSVPQHLQSFGKAEILLARDSSEDKTYHVGYRFTVDGKIFESLPDRNAPAFAQGKQSLSEGHDLLRQVVTNYWKEIGEPRFTRAETTFDVNEEKFVAHLLHKTEVNAREFYVQNFQPTFAIKPELSTSEISVLRKWRELTKDDEYYKVESVFAGTAMDANPKRNVMYKLVSEGLIKIKQEGVNTLVKGLQPLTPEAILQIGKTAFFQTLKSSADIQKDSLEKSLRNYAVKLSNTRLTDGEREYYAEKYTKIQTEIETLERAADTSLPLAVNADAVEVIEKVQEIALGVNLEADYDLLAANPLKGVYDLKAHQINRAFRDYYAEEIGNVTGFSFAYRNRVVTVLGTDEEKNLEINFKASGATNRGKTQTYQLHQLINEEILSKDDFVRLVKLSRAGEKINQEIQNLNLHTEYRARYANDSIYPDSLGFRIKSRYTDGDYVLFQNLNEDKITFFKYKVVDSIEDQKTYAYDRNEQREFASVKDALEHLKSIELAYGSRTAVKFGDVLSQPNSDNKRTVVFQDINSNNEVLLVDNILRDGGYDALIIKPIEEFEREYNVVVVKQSGFEQPIKRHPSVERFFEFIENDAVLADYSVADRNFATSLADFDKAFIKHETGRFNFSQELGLPVNAAEIDVVGYNSNASVILYRVGKDNWMIAALRPGEENYSHSAIGDKTNFTAIASEFTNLDKVVKGIEATGDLKEELRAAAWQKKREDYAVEHQNIQKFWAGGKDIDRGGIGYHYDILKQNNADDVPYYEFSLKLTAENAYALAFAAHRVIVKNAHAEGLEIPAEVLADYPELTQEKLAKTEVWELTFGEFDEAVWTGEINFALPGLQMRNVSEVVQVLKDTRELGDEQNIEIAEEQLNEYIRDFHRGAISLAFAKGLPVPAHVLDEYPNLIALRAEKETSNRQVLLPPADQIGRIETRIAKILHAHQIGDEIANAEEGFDVRLKNEPWMDLYISKDYGTNLIRLTHYYIQNGDMMHDGEMNFHIKDGRLALNQVAVALYGTPRYAYDRSFANMFSKNLIDQGFEKATLVRTQDELDEIEEIRETIGHNAAENKAKESEIVSAFVKSQLPEDWKEYSHFGAEGDVHINALDRDAYASTVFNMAENFYNEREGIYTSADVDDYVRENPIPTEGEFYFHFERALEFVRLTHDEQLGGQTRNVNVLDAAVEEIPVIANEPALTAQQKIDAFVVFLKDEYPEVGFSAGYIGNFTPSGDEALYSIYTNIEYKGQWGTQRAKFGSYNSYDELAKAVFETNQFDDFLYYWANTKEFQSNVEIINTLNRIVENGDRPAERFLKGEQPAERIYTELERTVFFEQYKSAFNDEKTQRIITIIGELNGERGASVWDLSKVTDKISNFDIERAERNGFIAVEKRFSSPESNSVELTENGKIIFAYLEKNEISQSWQMDQDIYALAQTAADVQTELDQKFTEQTLKNPYLAAPNFDENIIEIGIRSASRPDIIEGYPEFALWQTDVKERIWQIATAQVYPATREDPEDFQYIEPQDRQFEYEGAISRLFYENLLPQMNASVNRIAPESRYRLALEEEPTKVKQGTISLANEIRELLHEGKKIGNNVAFNKMAEAHFGGTRAGGDFDARDAYDALELGVNLYLLDNGRKFVSRSPNETLTEIRELVKRLPTQADRTVEQGLYQQFSTVPTESFVAFAATGMRGDDIVLEPSAGTGGLAVWSKILGLETHVNEISDRRAGILKIIGFNTVNRQDAQFLNDTLDQKIKPTLILMNPPFSATGGRTSNRTKYGAEHITDALLRLQDGGRLVAIVGEGMALDKPTFTNWWTEVMNKYNVRANVGVSGDEYIKYGTNFGNQILIIDKDGRTPGETAQQQFESVAKGNYENLESVLDVVNRIGADRRDPKEYQRRIAGEQITEESNIRDFKNLGEKPLVDFYSSHEDYHLKTVQGVIDRIVQRSPAKGSSDRLFNIFVKNEQGVSYKLNVGEGVTNTHSSELFGAVLNKDFKPGDKLTFTGYVYQHTEERAIKNITEYPADVAAGTKRAQTTGYALELQHETVKTGTIAEKTEAREINPLIALYDKARWQAIGIATGGRVERIEKSGYRVIFGTAIGETRYDIAGIVGPPTDKLIESGLTIEKVKFNNFEIAEKITRKYVKENPDKIFLFGDNVNQSGYGGQAREMRGEPNAIGIPTKHAPNTENWAYFTDKGLDENKEAIDKAFAKLAKFPPDTIIVFPKAGIGTGLAELNERAPQTFAYLQEKLNAIGLNETAAEQQANVAEESRYESVGAFVEKEGVRIFVPYPSLALEEVGEALTEYNRERVFSGVIKENSSPARRDLETVVLSLRERYEELKNPTQTPEIKDVWDAANLYHDRREDFERAEKSRQPHAVIGEKLRLMQEAARLHEAELGKLSPAEREKFSADYDARYNNEQTNEAVEKPESEKPQWRVGSDQESVKANMVILSLLEVKERTLEINDPVEEIDLFEAGVISSYGASGYSESLGREMDADWEEANVARLVINTEEKPAILGILRQFEEVTTNVAFEINGREYQLTPQTNTIGSLIGEFERESQMVEKFDGEDQEAENISENNLIPPIDLKSYERATAEEPSYHFDEDTNFSPEEVRADYFTEAVSLAASVKALTESVAGEPATKKEREDREKNLSRLENQKNDLAVHVNRTGTFFGKESEEYLKREIAPQNITIDENYNVIVKSDAVKPVQAVRQANLFDVAEESNSIQQSSDRQNAAETAPSENQKTVESANNIAGAIKLPEGFRLLNDEEKGRLLPHKKGQLVAGETTAIERNAEAGSLWLNAWDGKVYEVLSLVQAKYSQVAYIRDEDGNVDKEPTAGTYARPIFMPVEKPKAVSQAVGVEKEEEMGDVIGIGKNTAVRERIDNLGVVAYKPAKLKGGVDHPGDIVESASMAAVEPPDITYTPKLPKKVIKDGMLSSLQYEAVIYAGQRHNLILPNGMRAAKFIGDGTGVGKGRELGGIAADNWNQGRKRVLWMSINYDLVPSTKRDLNDLQASHIPLASLDKHSLHDDLNDTVGDGILFASYSTLIGKGKDDKNRFDQIVNWLGEDGVILFDEGHLAKNAVSDGRSETSQRGEAVVELQVGAKSNPNWRIVYSSATGMTDLINMGYMERLGIWGEGTGFPGGFGEFYNAIDKGGIGAMEMVARDMKAAGMYMSRSLSFRGVDYRQVHHELTPEQKEIYNLSSRAWSSVVVTFDEALRQTNANGKARMMAYGRLWSSQQMFYRQLMTALKVPSVIRETERVLAEGSEYINPTTGEKTVVPAQVIIGVIGTGESRTKDQVSKAMQLGLDLDSLDFSPKNILLNVVEKAFPTKRFTEEVNGSGNIVKVPVVDQDGKHVESQEALMMRDTLLAELNEKVTLPDNPLDQIVNYFGENAVAEITGRKRRIITDPNTGERHYVKRAREGVAMDKASQDEMNAYQAGRKRIAIISQSASTGISLHAELKPLLATYVQQGRLTKELAADVQNEWNKNGDVEACRKMLEPMNLDVFRRVHMTLETSWSADVQMQTFGRSHRSNQMMPPEYVLMSTDLGGEKRFLSTIAKRLSSLGALTKGDREQAGGGNLLQYDFENKYGVEAAKKIVAQLRDGKASLMTMLPPDTETGEEQSGLRMLYVMGLARKEGNAYEVTEETMKNLEVSRFLNRVLMLDVDTQNTVFDAFVSEMEGIIQHDKELGLFDEGVQDIEGENIRFAAEPRIVTTDKATGAHTYYNQINADTPTHPVTLREISDRQQVVRLNGIEIGDSKNKGVFYQQINSRNIVYAEFNYARPNPKTGSMERFYKFARPSGWQTNLLPEHELMSKYTPVQLDQNLTFKDEMRMSAKTWWNNEVSETPKTQVNTYHLITGAVLPVWQRLSSSNEAGNQLSLKTVRIETIEGERVVGVQIPTNHISRVLRDLGVEQSQKTPEEVFNAVIENKQTVDLVEGIKLKPEFLKKQPIIQIMNLSSRHKENQFVGFGALREQPGFEVKYFVPNDREKGLEVLARILEKFPAVDSAAEIRAKELAAKNAQAKTTGSATFAESLQNTINNLTGNGLGDGILAKIGDKDSAFAKRAAALENEPLSKYWWMMKSEANEKGQVLLNAASFEYARTVYKEAMGIRVEHFDGLFNNELVTERFIETLNRHAEKGGIYAESIRSLTNTIEAGRNSHEGRVLVLLTDERASMHEELHVASHVASLGKSLEERHAFFDELKNHEAYILAKTTLSAIHKTDNDGILVEECFVEGASGKAEKLGLLPSESAEFTELWFKSFAAKNGIVSKEKFKELTDESRQIRDRAYSAIYADEIKRAATGITQSAGIEIAGESISELSERNGQRGSDQSESDEIGINADEKINKVKPVKGDVENAYDLDSPEAVADAYRNLQRLEKINLPALAPEGSQTVRELLIEQGGANLEAAADYHLQQKALPESEKDSQWNYERKLETLGFYPEIRNDQENHYKVTSLANVSITPEKEIVILETEQMTALDFDGYDENDNLIEIETYQGDRRTARAATDEELENIYAESLRFEIELKKSVADILPLVIDEETSPEKSEEIGKILESYALATPDGNHRETLAENIADNPQAAEELIKYAAERSVRQWGHYDKMSPEEIVQRRDESLAMWSKAVAEVNQESAEISNAAVGEILYKKSEVDGQLPSAESAEIKNGDAIFETFKGVFKEAGMERILDSKDGFAEFETPGHDPIRYQLELTPDGEIKFAEMEAVSERDDSMMVSRGIAFSKDENGSYRYAGSFQRIEGTSRITEITHDEAIGHYDAEFWKSDGLGKNIIIRELDLEETKLAAVIRQSNERNLDRHHAEQLGRQIIADANLSEKEYALNEFEKNFEKIKFTVEVTSGDGLEKQSVSLEDLEIKRRAYALTEVAGDKNTGILRMIAESKEKSIETVEKEQQAKAMKTATEWQKPLIEAVLAEAGKERATLVENVRQARLISSQTAVETNAVSKQNNDREGIQPSLPIETVWSEQIKAAQRGDVKLFTKLEEMHQAENVPRPNDVYARLRGIELLTSLEAERQNKEVIAAIGQKNTKSLYVTLQKGADGLEVTREEFAEKNRANNPLPVKTTAEIPKSFESIEKLIEEISVLEKSEKEIFLPESKTVIRATHNAATEFTKESWKIQEIDTTKKAVENRYDGVKELYDKRESDYKVREFIVEKTDEGYAITRTRHTDEKEESQQSSNYWETKPVQEAISYENAKVEIDGLYKNLVETLQSGDYVAAKKERTEDREIKELAEQMSKANAIVERTKQEASDYRNRAADERRSANQAALQPLSNMVNPFSPVAGKLAWITRPTETLNAHINPIEIIKNDPGVQIIRAVSNYFEHRGNAKVLDEIAQETLQKVERLKEELAPEVIGNADKMAKAVQTAVRREEMVRSDFREIEETNADLLKTPERAVNDAEMKNVGKTAADLGEAGLLEQFNKAVETSSKLAENIGETGERIAAKNLLAQAKAANISTQAIENVRLTETGAMEVEINPVRLLEAQRQIATSEVAEEFQNRMVERNISLPRLELSEAREAEILSNQLVANDELSKYITSQYAKAGDEMAKAMQQPLNQTEQELLKKMTLPEEVLTRFEEIQKSDRTVEELYRQAELATANNVPFQNVGQTFTVTNPSDANEAAARDFWKADREQREIQIAQERVLSKNRNLQSEADTLAEDELIDIEEMEDLAEAETVAKVMGL